MEKLLRENVDIFQNAFEHAALGMVLADIYGNFMSANQWFAQYLGYSTEEMAKKNFQELTHPDDLDKDEQQMALLRAGQITNFQMEKRYIHRLGHPVWGLLNVSYVTYGPENLTHVLAQIQDITERKHAEEARKSSEERFAKAFTASPSAMAIISAVDGRFIDLNQAMETILGYVRHEVIGKNGDQLRIWVSVRERSKIIENTERYVRATETRLRNKRGEIKVGLVAVEPISLEGESCSLVVIQDITERLAIEKEMFRLQSLNLIGEMAASVGHEIRNPMTTVRGFLQMFATKDEFQPHREILDLMVDELDRANSIIVEFLSLSRDKRVHLEEINLNQVLQTLYPLIKADALKLNMDVELELQEVDLVTVDEKEIRQLILNLTRNGLEAMKDGGKLIIHTYQQGQKVIVAVQDQGAGIPDEVLDKLGRPFFTTKDSGTGLGLAVCYSVAQRNNATIQVETGSTGTTFTVTFMTLPRHEKLLGKNDVQNKNIFV